MGYHITFVIGCIHNLRSQGHQNKSPFPRITCEMWNSCVGLLIQIFHFSHTVYKCVLDLNNFLLTT